MIDEWTARGIRSFTSPPHSGDNMETFVTEMFLEAGKSAKIKNEQWGILTLEVFVCGSVPLKFTSEDEQVATKRYCMAVDAQFAIGPPAFLVRVYLPWEAVGKAFAKGWLTRSEYCEGLYFKKLVQPEYYEGVIVEYKDVICGCESG